MLFMDVKSAFYTATTEVTLGAMLTLPSRRVALSQAGMSEQGIDDFTGKFTVGTPLLEQWGFGA